MTEPDAKETWRPLVIPPSQHDCAVREFACVAIIMPM